MTGKERMDCILHGKPTDRIGLYEHFWPDTISAWQAAGALQPGQTADEVFPFDLVLMWSFDFTADLDFVPQVVAETEDTITQKDGNGAVLRRHKKHDTTPEHVDFTVKDRAGWEEYIKPRLTPDERRINFADYRKSKAFSEQLNRFFCWTGINVFESIHPVCGHENMLVGMALDPDWIVDMANTYADLTIALWEILFAKEGKPDGIWFYEDMGFKERPFMSPAMYRELIFPAHKKTIDFAHSLGLPVIMHSCGFVEPLLPDMIAAGIDCLQAMEVKAGMDLLRIHKNFGDRIALMGGIDIRTLCTGDRAAIDAELEDKIPIVKHGFGYTLHTDHSVPSDVAFETYQYFVEKGLQLGQL